MDLRDQGRFAIGYYHQSSARFKKTAGEAAEAAETVTDNN
jgi:hypothetical protein